ncbi:hypothetical protein PsYK624_090380 [Phanerochaete sordida]|uniref:F-box domain-containing protein n=1 Tax=Phanerochaete sordida TaxID=48140 RepID=A0A9P3GFP1_9APHY|nr:hypothetical protein PsYK624_090380 [Phanerochaete sordida]
MEHEYDSLGDFASIDAAITKHRSITQRLCTFRNSRVPIWRIPDEILSRIFLFVASDQFYYSVYARYTWMQIVYVCMRWHRVCFATHQLWAFVDLGNADRVRALLRLSGNAPLIISQRKPFEPNALRLCLAEMSRIRHFAFEPYESLIYPPGGVDHSYLPQITGISKVLSLHLNFASPTFARVFVSSSLTHLRCGTMDPPFSVEEMLAVLDSAPRLLDLELSGALEYIKSLGLPGVVHRSKTVALPALRCMALQDDSTAGVSCALLLQSLQLPPHVSISLKFGFNEYDMQPLYNLADTLRHIASTLISYGNRPRTCRIRQDEPRPCQFSSKSDLVCELWPVVHQLSALSDFSSAPSKAGHVTITLSTVPRSCEMVVFYTTLAALPLSDVSVLAAHLPSYPRGIGDSWLTDLASVTHVSAAAHAFAYDLVKDLAAPSDPPLPRLREIMLGDVQWDKGLPLDTIPLSQRCREVLQARLAKGVPLRSLALRGTTGVDEGALVKLQDSGLVERVEFCLCGDANADVSVP